MPLGAGGEAPPALRSFGKLIMKIRLPELRNPKIKAVLQLQARVFFIAGLAALSWYAFVFLESRFVQARENARLNEAIAAGRLGKPLLASRVSEGGLIGRIEIARLGLSSIILRGMEGKSLRLGVAHVEGTPFPGEPGNVGLAGHRDTFFRPLKEVREGDLIRVTTLDGTFEYRVKWARIVAPEDTYVLNSDGDALTLITCYPFSYLGNAPKRFVVHANLNSRNVVQIGNFSLPTRVLPSIPSSFIGIKVVPNDK